MTKTTTTEIYNGDGTLRERIVVTETEEDVPLQQWSVPAPLRPTYPYGPNVTWGQSGVSGAVTNGQFNVGEDSNRATK